MSKSTAFQLVDPGRPADEPPGCQSVRIARLKRPHYDAVVAMLGRCSAATLQQRFHGVTTGVPYVTRLLGHATNGIGYGAWLGSRCVGLGSLHFACDTTAELAVLIEDDWQHRGVGSALAAEIIRLARGRGLRALRAEVLADNHFIPSALARFGPVRASISCGVYTIWLDLEQPGTDTEGVA
jgi:GNAT superfamily N-acetyltransferase